MSVGAFQVIDPSSFAPFISLAANLSSKPLFKPSVLELGEEEENEHCPCFHDSWLDELRFQIWFALVINWMWKVNRMSGKCAKRVINCGALFEFTMNAWIKSYGYCHNLHQLEWFCLLLMTYHNSKHSVLFKSTLMKVIAEYSALEISTHSKSIDSMRNLNSTVIN